MSKCGCRRVSFQPKNHLSEVNRFWKENNNNNIPHPFEPAQRRMKRKGEIP